MISSIAIKATMIDLLTSEIIPLDHAAYYRFPILPLTLIPKLGGNSTKRYSKKIERETKRIE